MSYAFPPELERLVQQKMAAGGYATEDELLLSAFQALDAMESRHERLRDDIRNRLSRRGQELALPLDLEAFRTEARRRTSNTQ